MLTLDFMADFSARFTVQPHPCFKNQGMTEDIVVLSEDEALN